MVLLIGNYPLDRQQSMQRFTNMMLQGLTFAGISAEIVSPTPVLGKFFGAHNLIGKWFGYLDKFLFFPRQLRKRLSGQAALVHICDHSNAMYHRAAKRSSVVVTCHDLIAVRSALGEELHCPVSFTGRVLQRWILRSLRHADTVVCVSESTRDDAERLVGRGNPSPKLETIHNGLNYSYRKLTLEDALARLSAVPNLAMPFILHVGSNLPRKNRDAVLRIFARTKDNWNARIVFAGDALDAEQRALSEQLKIADRVIEIENASDQLLEALYSCATALLYPSLSEGFGWPIIEAHACGCPVVCTDIAPMPETAGDAGLLHQASDEAGFAADILRLNDPAERRIWSEKSVRNAERFSTEKMISRYIDVYRSLGAQL